jgi:hypothetical protein
MNFTLGLIELFAYLIPGLSTVAVAAVVVFGYSADDLSVPTSMGILVGGYVVGHALTVLSRSLAWMRGFVKLAVRAKAREERYSFYGELQGQLRSLFGEDVTKPDEYTYCLRLVVEHCPSTTTTVDRLYALTLFSRNMTLAMTIASVLCVARSASVSFLMIVLAVLFFVRYYQFERHLESTVFRAAYVHLKVNGGALANNALKPNGGGRVPD